ncbi:MAG: hypothetical protein FIB06_00240 [Betaproteobacteria bacterium]|nr:hypothetical protein [Betaproteobacteria bacterium]
MRHRDCPACGYTVPLSGVRIDPAAPRTLTSSWPRFLCPNCGVELRSSNRSLLPAVLMFVFGLPLLLGSGYLPEKLAGLAEVLGSVFLLLCVRCAHWFHRWDGRP